MSAERDLQQEKAKATEAERDLSQAELAHLTTSKAELASLSAKQITPTQGIKSEKGFLETNFQVNARAKATVIHAQRELARAKVEVKRSDSVEASTALNQSIAFDRSSIETKSLKQELRATEIQPDPGVISKSRVKIERVTTSSPNGIVGKQIKRRIRSNYTETILDKLMNGIAAIIKKFEQFILGRLQRRNAPAIAPRVVMPTQEELEKKKRQEKKPRPL